MKVPMRKDRTPKAPKAPTAKPRRKAAKRTKATRYKRVTRSTHQFTVRNFVELPELNSGQLPTYLHFKTKDDQTQIKYVFENQIPLINKTVDCCIKVYTGTISSCSNTGNPRFSAAAKLIVYSDQLSFYYYVHGENSHIESFKRSDIYDINFTDFTGEKIAVNWWYNKSRCRDCSLI